MPPDATIRTITDLLARDARVRALYLGGSHATGLADGWSDIDLVLVTPEGPADAIAALWRQAVAQTGEIVMWWDRTPNPALINAITADWTRIDVLLLRPTDMAGQTQDGLRPLFDHDGIHATLPLAPAPAAPPDPARFLRQVQDVIKILGLLHLVVGRGEYLNGVVGAGHLRAALVALMIAETAAPGRGGALHLNRLLTADQRAELMALPAPTPTRDGVIAAHLACAAAYLPRARARARLLGVAWPERFETATWDLLDRQLGISRPAL
jgi:predicted nucleotidyltransferase